MKKNSKKNNQRELNKLNIKYATSRVFRFRKDVETVFKLNMKSDNESPLNSPKKIILSPIKLNTKQSPKNSLNSESNESNDNINSNQYDKYRKELNKFSDSLRQLKQYFPNNTDIKELEKSIGITAPARLDHIKLENNLKSQIHEIDTQVEALKSKKDMLESQFILTEKKILDHQLNIEVALDMEKENNTKLIKEKLINEFQNQFYSNNKEKENKDKENNDKENKEKEIKNRRKLLTSSREFQEKFDMFIKREEYLTKQKEKQIEKDILNEKQNKQNIIKKLSKYNNDIKELHKIKNFLVEKLYEHYLNVLKEGKDTRNEGLSWVIREIFSLDKKVMLSFMPLFLDKLCIKYIFEMTHLNIKLTGIENEIKKTKNEFKKVGIIGQGDESIVNQNILKTSQNNMTTNELTQNYWNKIRQMFGKSSSMNKKEIKLNSIKTNKSANVKVGLNKSIKKLRTFVNIPLFSGDPNSHINQNKTIGNINQLLKDEQKQSSKIPEVLKVKDYTKLTNNTGYFLNSDEIKKIQNYLSLKTQLNNLRKKKETMKTNEMTRIFKEFQRNDYENKFNVDKMTVISALIGEDNLNSELVKQSKREKKYIEAILRGRMHVKMKSVDKAMMEKNLSGDNNENPLNKMVKSMNGFEIHKNQENEKNKFNLSRNYGMTF